MLFNKSQPRVLAIGAHPDDIELGAGGFLHRLSEQHDAEIHFLILTAGVQSRGPAPYESSQREQEARSAAALLCKNHTARVLQFTDCCLHEHGHDIIGKIESVLGSSGTVRGFDLVLTHAGDDTHSDHRVVHESTVSAVRDFHGVVLLYQAPSTKPNGFRPTFFAEMDDAMMDRKVAALDKHMSQRDKPFMHPLWARRLAESWALYLRRPGGTYLEAFEVYKSFYLLDRN